jgi:phosphotransferase system HPr (HPr) family protein
MLEQRLMVRNALGLHARAAAAVVRQASRFRSEVLLMRPDKSVFANAKSILSVLTLAAPIGTELVLQVTGSDEQEAFSLMVQLFENGFGEA